MTISPPDKHARLQALDPHQSFIVQAPAGSGKTELLIQRFLVLLAHVEKTPEEIIAITFTRKAASEMRQRVLEALESAQHPAPDASHARQTWELARKVLELNAAKGWGLLDNPQRLQIQTIDSLCMSLIRRMPLLAKLGGTPNILENPRECYLEAVRRLMAKLESEESYAKPLSHLLLHLNNQVSLLEILFTDMLSKRDQWLPYLMSYYHDHSPVSFRDMLESGLKHIVNEALSGCHENMPHYLKPELKALMQFADEQFMRAESDENNLSDYDYWLKTADFLLTKENTWRKMVNKTNGFPPENKEMKSKMMFLLEELSEDEVFRQYLENVRVCPPPQYSESQWKTVESLIEILPLLVAELSVVFGEKNVSDFTEITLAAIRALGDMESPSELALILDYQIRHFLIDEFQDTSTTQFRLLTQLTRGWEKGDRRTLFLVGDPMQSIYRFREAEVGLFLKAQKEGLGDIELTPIYLTSNFRSSPNIVSWVNQQFEQIFPKNADISSGAVVFNSSTAVKDRDESSSVFIHSNTDAQDQAEKMIELIQHERRLRPNHSIGLLVRSRTHLIHIIPALKMAGIAFTAVEVESLKSESIIHDLMALTTALIHLSDRVAWLAILRAPWCGLSLKDLHALCGRNHQLLVWDLMQTFEDNPQLSLDAKLRLKKMHSVLSHSFYQRQRLPLRIWVEGTWKALGGPRCLLSQHELATANIFFSMLEEMEVSGDLLDLEMLSQKIQEQFATPENTDESVLHVMTIHKAKGLEFDMVIVPHLEQKGRGESERLLRWLDRPRASGENDLLLAPIKSKEEREDAVYRYLHLTETKKVQYEMARLFYVAVTRAKKTLHLLANNQGETRGPSKNSFLSLVQEIFKEKESLLPVSESVLDQNELSEKSKVFRRMYLSDIEKNIFIPKGEVSSINYLAKSEVQKPSDMSSHIGTVVHRVLQKISQTSLQEWAESKIKQERSVWKKWLKKMGVISSQLLEEGVNVVEEMILSTLNDARGRWILEKKKEAASEYALTTVVHDMPVRLMIDRTFVEDGACWIIDYKTSALEDENLEVFLDRAVIMHREQLEQYATALEKIETRPIRLGLYFVRFGGWREWVFERETLGTIREIVHPEI